MGSRAIVSLACVVMLAGGCRATHRIAGQVRQPAEVTASYLKYLYAPRQRPEAYECFTTKARERIPYTQFLRLLRAEAPESFNGVAKVRPAVKIIDEVAVLENHRVVYALLTLTFPYTTGATDTYRLVRIHCYRDHGDWFLEPYINEEAFTIRLIPTLEVGYLRHLDRRRGDMASLIVQDRDQVLGQAERAALPPQERSGETAPLVIPDLTEEAAAAQNAASGPDPEAAVEALLTIGKVYYQTGQVDRAEESFQKVLALNPNDETAKEYLQRCQNLRLLQREKEEQIRLYERLLEIDESESRPVRRPLEE